MRNFLWNRFVAQFRPQLLHVQFGFNLIETLDLLKKTNLPVVTTFHGSDINMATFDRTYFDQIVAAFKRVDLGLFVSEALKKHAVEIGFPESKASVHRIGTELPELNPKAYFPAISQANEMVICCVARLVPCKGHETLLCAFRKLLAVKDNVKLRIIGDGPMRHRLNWLVEKNALTQFVEFTGEMEHKFVLQSIEKSHVVVLCSQQADNGQAEGVPVALMEAAALAKPIIATRCGGIPELIDHEVSGLLTAPRDANGLKSAILSVLDNRDLAIRIGQNARNVVEKRFDVNKCQRRLLNIYQKTITDFRKGRQIPDLNAEMDSQALK